VSGAGGLQVPPSPREPRAGESFFRSRWAEAPAGVEELDPDGLAPGFRSAGSERRSRGSSTDVALMSCETDPGRLATAILLTRNASAAAPVVLCREGLDAGRIRGVVVNSGNANASTGEQGLRDAEAMQAKAANVLGVEPREIAVAETGTIGVPLPIEEVLDGIADCGPRLEPGAAGAFTRAIMTTDAFPKRCTVRKDGVTVSAQAKGAGMIEPGYATMLCFVQTDGDVSDPDATLRRAVAGSFERITVDGQMSTNDTVVLQATREAGLPLPEGLLDAVLLQLALEIVADGEGASRVGRIEVTGARDEAEADRVARAIANSPLVKTALFGRDPNWGRIAQAAGMALAGEPIGELGPDVIDATGLADEAPEAEISLRLDRGDGAAHIFFSDLTHTYIEINAEYTT
jgi:glutamate N-acetyltransferase / amino-acid N-acetyltransferase